MFARQPAREPRPKMLANRGQSMAWTMRVTAMVAARRLSPEGQPLGRASLTVGMASRSPAMAA
jgi:hypothetical protein